MTGNEGSAPNRVEVQVLVGVSVCVKFELEMREFWSLQFLIVFLLSLSSLSSPVEREEDITIAYEDGGTTNDENDPYYYYYYYSDEGTEPDVPTIVTTFAPVILVTNIPFAIWTPVPEGSKSPSPTGTPSYPIPTLRPSTSLPSHSNSPTTSPTPYPSPAPSPTITPTPPQPTLYPTPTTSAPTVDPTYTPSSNPSTPPPSTHEPTGVPTMKPTLAPVTSTEVPTRSPTEPPGVWQLGFPKLFSKSMDSVLLTVALLCGLLWIVAIVYMIIASYRKQRWSFQTVYDSLAPSSTHPKGETATTIGGFKRRKIVQNKYEDYWGEDSEDTLNNFPTRASTLGAGYGYGTVRSLPLSSRAGGGSSSAQPSYEDYWDENIDFSIRSTDSFGLK